MARTTIECLDNLRKGRYDYLIKVRVIRKWRNATTLGKLVDGFNIILLDDKNITMQAFVGDKRFKQKLEYIVPGAVYLIENFSVKDVTEKDKNLITQNKTQIFFTDHTTVEKCEETESLIPINYFDFYDIADLQEVQKQDRYLTDIIGVLQDYEPIRKWVSKKDSITKKAIVKFSLTDGSSSIKATFWDEWAEKFHAAMVDAVEEPYIVIVAAVRIILLRDELQIAPAKATMFFVNYRHHSVHQLRQEIVTEPNLTQQGLSTRRNIVYDFATVAELKKFNKDNIGKKVVLMLNIRKIESNYSWFYFECTSCLEELTEENGEFYCSTCDREVPSANCKFSVQTICSDDTGIMGLSLPDREVKRLIATTVYELTDNHYPKFESGNFPEYLNQLIHLNIRAMIELNEENLADGCNVFVASEVAWGHTDDVLTVSSPVNHTTVTQSNSQFTEPSTSTSEYHLDEISQLQLVTPEQPIKQDGKRRIKHPARRGGK